MEHADLRIRLTGTTRMEPLESLYSWLKTSAELKAVASLERNVPNPGQMGAVADAIVLSVSAGGAITTLAAALKVWLSQPRRSKVEVSITRLDGEVKEVRVSADRANIDAIGHLLEGLLEHPEGREH